MARHALLVGVSRFRDARLAALNAPERDVQALAEVLRDPARGGFSSVTVSTDESFVDLRDRLAALFNGRDPEDLLLLYYSGHGILRTGNRLYLATTETVLDQPQARGIAAAEVRDLMDQTRAARQVLVLDCCHSGAFAPGAKGGDTTAVNEGTFGDADSTGRYVLAASNAQQFAWDGDRLASGDSGARTLSRFTAWLVDGIGRGEAAPDEPDISMDALFRYVSRRAKAEGSPAIPQRFVDRNAEDVVIARNPAAAAQADVAALATGLSDPDWERRLSAVEALAKLTRRPSSREAARDALADRLGAERDFKVRAALLRALERPADPPPAPDPRPEVAGRLSGATLPPGWAPARGPLDEERATLEQRAARNSRFLWWAAWVIVGIDVLLVIAAIQEASTRAAFAIQYPSIPASPVAPESTPAGALLAAQFLAALAGLIPNPLNRPVAPELGVTARSVVLRSGMIIFERQRYRRACYLLLAAAFCAIGIISQLR